jgi:hypothetical protein
MNKDLKILVDRLDRIFPNIELYFSTVEFNDGKDVDPEHTINWYEFIKILNENGLCIKDNKEIN